jgi:uroporphyrinogen decarboxylase
MVAMNSRERVEKTLELKKPDMVPLSIGSTSNDCFTKMALRKYAKYLNLAPYEEIVTWTTVQTVITPVELKEKYHSDFKTVWLKKPDNPKPVITFDDGSILDAMGVRLQPTDYYYDAVSRPLGGSITVSDVRDFNWPDPYDKGLTRGLEEETAKIYDETEYALVADYLALGPFEGALWVRGWEDFLCDLYSDTKLAEAIMEKITDYTMGLWDQMLSAAGKYLNVVCLNDDLGMQDRSLISSDIYRKYVKKYTKRWYDFVRSKTKAKILHHSCGSCYELINDLIDCGIQILNPLQVSAANMQPEKLKKEFGDRIAFWGGLDVQTVLPNGTVRQVKDEVKRLIDTFGDGGGYILAPSHNIQPDVPMENISAMFDAALEYRRY